jgi:hypothetical protein
MKYFAACLLMAVAGCTTPADNAQPVGGEAKDPVLAGCDATKLQYAVGQKSSAALGAKLMRESGAKTLRWMPPRTAATMDFRSDRLNIAYDDAMVITAVDCG